MSDFQRRHYKAIAAVLTRMGDPNARMDMALMLADMFKRDNSHFDTSKFLDACDVHPRPVPGGVLSSPRRMAK